MPLANTNNQKCHPSAEFAEIRSHERELVKKIEAIIRRFNLEDVKNALIDAGVDSMTVTEVLGFGRQRGHKDIYSETAYVVDFLPKVKLEVIVPDKIVRDTVDTIIRIARTGHIGDGKIFVTDVSEDIRSYSWIG